MALKDSRGGREYDKFVADGSGDTAVRTQATATSATVETTGGTIASPVTVGVAGATTLVGTEILGATSVAGHERMALQFFWVGINTGTTLTFKVWGSLFTTPGDPVPTVAASTKWTQIGDNITVSSTGTTAGSFNAFKAISTTPMEYIAVTCVSASGTDNTVAVYMLAD
jgi:hypothetical protein